MFRQFLLNRSQFLVHDQSLRRASSKCSNAYRYLLLSSSALMSLKSDEEKPLLQNQKHCEPKKDSLESDSFADEEIMMMLLRLGDKNKDSWSDPNSSSRSFEVKPAARGNEAIREASKNGHVEVVKILVDPSTCDMIVEKS